MVIETVLVARQLDELRSGHGGRRERDAIAQDAAPGIDDEAGVGAGRTSRRSATGDDERSGKNRKRA